MSGQIIQFDRYGDLPRGRLFRGEAVPRGSSPRIARTAPRSRDAAMTGSIPKCDGLENRIARIGELLDELERCRFRRNSQAALTRAEPIEKREIIRPLQEARAVPEQMGRIGLPRVADATSASSTMRFGALLPQPSTET